MSDLHESHKPSLPFKLAQRVFMTLARFTRGMTLGVRALVLTPDNRIFLVRHSYVPGWHMPGGGVEAGETLEEALAKELGEEGNITLTGQVVLLGVYLNRRASARDHVAVYVVRNFDQSAPHVPDREIVETGFFPLDALPEGTTQATRRRIGEALHSMAITQEW